MLIITNMAILQISDVISDKFNVMEIMHRNGIPKVIRHNGIFEKYRKLDQ
jgi:hypothetical protein